MNNTHFQIFYLQISLDCKFKYIFVITNALFNFQNNNYLSVNEGNMLEAMANTNDTTYYDAYDVCITPTTPRSIKTSEVATEIRVHPNPTSGILYLNLPNNYTGHVAVRDIDGKAVFHQEIKSSNLTSLDLTMYCGVYFVTFTADSGVQSIHKVILIK